MDGRDVMSQEPESLGDCLAHYREHGYGVVRGVFGVDDVRALAEAFDRVYARALRHRTSFRDRNVFFQVAEDPALGRIVRIAQWPSYFDAVLARYRTDPRILAIVAPLIGRNLKQIINQLHWKPPGAAKLDFGYHQDIHFRRPAEAYRDAGNSYIQTMIAVDPQRPENGGLAVYPGSHKLGALTFPERGRIMDADLSEADLLALGLDPARLVHLVLEPGDLAFWHLCTIHGSGPNASRIDRRAYLNGYVTAANCDRGEWAFREGRACALGEPVLVHYEDLHTRPGPLYVDEA
jgi:ectoine hydroxylase-related dioxygenase (phytanoyl-CoA dioxygenase family)